MGFRYQAVLQRQVEPVKEIFARYEFDAGKIIELAKHVDHFEIRIPFIGGFSSGKSSLINVLIQERLLSTEVTPETAVAAEVRHGMARKFQGCWPDGRTLNVTEEQVQENQLAMLQPDGWLSVELPSEVLAAAPHLVLVDMPGWGSGVEAHERVIDDYADRSLAYAVVVSVEEGTLRDSLRAALLELAIASKPVILVISKAHKRVEADALSVAQRLSGEITELLGYAPLSVVLTSAAKHDVAQLKQALGLLESRAEEVFNRSIVARWRDELQRAAQLTRLLANQDFNDAELIKAEIENFEHRMCEFDERLVRETEGLDERIGPMLGAIRVRVENALAGRLEALTERALAGCNISDDILGTARLVVAQALKDEFEPTIQRYLDRLVDALPSSLDFNFNFSHLQEGGQSSAGGDFHWKALTSVLLPLLAKIPHPLAKIVAVVLPILTRLFGSNAEQQRQEIEEARQRERARSQVREALTQAAEQIEAQLRPVMREQVKKASEAVAQNIAIEKADIERTLMAKRQALVEGEARASAQREQAQTDLERLEQWLAEVREVSHT